MTTRRPHAGLALRCSWCHDTLAASGLRCEGCGTLVHAECALELGGGLAGPGVCPLGCATSELTVPPAPPLAPAPAQVAAPRARRPAGVRRRPVLPVRPVRPSWIGLALRGLVGLVVAVAAGVVTGLALAARLLLALLAPWLGAVAGLTLWFGALQPWLQGALRAGFDSTMASCRSGGALGALLAVPAGLLWMAVAAALLLGGMALSPVAGFHLGAGVQRLLLGRDR